MGCDTRRERSGLGQRVRLHLALVVVELADWRVLEPFIGLGREEL